MTDLTQPHVDVFGIGADGPLMSSASACSVDKASFVAEVEARLATGSCRDQDTVIGDAVVSSLRRLALLVRLQAEQAVDESGKVSLIVGAHLVDFFRR